MQRLTDSILLLEDNLMFGLLLGKLRHSKDLYFNEGLVIIREADFSPRRRWWLIWKSLISFCEKTLILKFMFIIFRDKYKK